MKNLLNDDLLGAAKGNCQPKYKVVFDSLKESLASGEYKPGARLPSEGELERRFGVSRMTVVKAVRDLQQLGLVVRRAGSGTYATMTSAAGDCLFGLLIPALGQTEIFEPICQGMSKYSTATKHSLLWGNAASETEKTEEVAEHLCHQFIGRGVSGVFFAPLELTPIKDQVNQKIVAALERARIPVVLLDRCLCPYPMRSKYDLVGIDNRRTAYFATDHLARVGAVRIAFFSRQFSASTVNARIAGYREALFAHRLLTSEDLVFCGDPCDGDLVRSILDKHRPDAFLCANDRTAANLMQNLLALGTRVPEDVRIVGIDDVKYASLLPVPLTTQHQPCLDIGAVAMSTMLQRVQNPSLPTRDVLVGCTLVVRKSCGAYSPASKLPRAVAQ
ncbi:MAG: substrate-binding domain-containing protein [Candidatus Solibacter sp.]|nr:substrate-binding domain-containing protein [Candidatus Solibacter sp.]